MFVEDLQRLGYLLPSDIFDQSNKENFRNWNEAEKLNDLTMKDKLPKFFLSIAAVLKGKIRSKCISFILLEYTNSVPQAEVHTEPISLSDNSDELRDTLNQGFFEEEQSCSECANLREQLKICKKELSDCQQENQRLQKIIDQPSRKSSFHSQEIGVLSPVNTRSRRSSIMSMDDSSRQSIDSFCSRAPRNELKPPIMQYIIGLATSNMQSYRQTSDGLELLYQSLPVFNQSFPERTSVSKIIQGLPLLNSFLAQTFMEAATSLVVAFDGRTKKSNSYFAVFLIDQNVESFALPAEHSVDGTSSADAGLCMYMIKAVGGICSKFGIMENADIWTKKQLSNVCALMSDSCNQANKTKKNLVKDIRNEVGNQAQTINILDCGKFDKFFNYNF